MSSPRTAWIGVCIACVVQACSGSGEGLDVNGRPLDPGGGAGSLTPDLASIQANVFTPVCTQCHVGANAPMGLSLEAGNSYGALVGVASSQASGLLRVEPGDPSNSYLVQKLEGRAAVGARMPLGLPALPDATIAVIRQWIADGAPNAGADAGALLKVQSVAVTTTQINIALSRSVDASLVNPTTVSLEWLSGAASSAAVEAVPASVVVSPHNDALIVVAPRQALRSGRYKLTLRGTGAAALADWNAIVIDGDDDGTPGGDWTGALNIGQAQ